MWTIDIITVIICIPAKLTPINMNFSKIAAKAQNPAIRRNESFLWFKNVKILDAKVKIPGIIQANKLNLSLKYY